MKIIISITLVISLSINLYSQKSDSLQNLDLRVKSLEQFQSNLDEKYEIKKQELEVKFDRLKLGIDKENVRLEVIIWIFGSVTFLGLVVSIISFYIRINRIAISKSEKIIEAKFEDERDKLIQIIASQTEENKLRNKRMIVLSDIKSEDTFLKKFFKEMGFTKIRFKNTSDQKSLTNYDLLFINNESGGIDKETIDNYCSKSIDSSVLFYFNTNGIRYINENVANRLSFANSRTQIYGNLINLLKYQAVISE